MRKVTRIPAILEQIEQIWEKYPDLRLGQLIVNVISDSNPTSLYYIEDEDLISKLQDYYGFEF